MAKLSDEQKTEYFRRSYTAVDGLWFMKVEERHGFEEALRLDEAVWKTSTPRLCGLLRRSRRTSRSLGYRMSNLLYPVDRINVRWVDECQGNLREQCFKAVRKA